MVLHEKYTGGSLRHVSVATGHRVRWIAPVSAACLMAAIAWTGHAAGTPGPAGPVHLTASASGTVGGGPATVKPASADMTAQAPAQLTATFTTDRTAVSVGQTLRLTLTVQNTGGADANNVTAATPTVASGATATTAAITAIAAGPVTLLHAGASASFVTKRRPARAAF